MPPPSKGAGSIDVLLLTDKLVLNHRPQDFLHEIKGGSDSSSQVIISDPQVTTSDNSQNAVLLFPSLRSELRLSMLLFTFKVRRSLPVLQISQMANWMSPSRAANGATAIDSAWSTARPVHRVDFVLWTMWFESESSNTVDCRCRADSILLLSFRISNKRHVPNEPLTTTKLSSLFNGRTLAADPKNEAVLEWLESEACANSTSSWDRKSNTVTLPSLWPSSTSLFQQFGRKSRHSGSECKPLYEPAVKVSEYPTTSMLAPGRSPPWANATLDSLRWVRRVVQT